MLLPLDLAQVWVHAITQFTAQHGGGSLRDGAVWACLLTTLVLFEMLGGNQGNYQRQTQDPGFGCFRLSTDQ